MSDVPEPLASGEMLARDGEAEVAWPVIGKRETDVDETALSFSELYEIRRVALSMALVTPSDMTDGSSQVERARAYLAFLMGEAGTVDTSADLSARMARLEEFGKRLRERMFEKAS